jgi:outer membrane protein, heavy metal efflux system
MKKKVLQKILYSMSFILVVSWMPFLPAAPAERTGEDFYTGHPLLEEMISNALLSNPALRRGIASYRASLQKIPQVRSLPDPMLSFTQYLRSPETRVGPQSNITMLSQKFPWFGKLDLKGQIAASEASAIYQEYLAREKNLAARLKKSFYELSYVDRVRGILDEEFYLLDHYEKLSQVRYAQGRGRQLPVIKIQAEITRLLDRKKLLQRQRVLLVSRLNTLMNLPPEQEIPLVTDIPIPELSLNTEQLNILGEDNRRELRASLDRIEKSDQAIELAKKSYWPDFTLSAGMANVEGREDPAGRLLPPPDNGKNPFSVTLGINIPLWRDKYRSGVLEAAENRTAEQQNYFQIRNEMEFSISDLTSRLQTLGEQMDLYDSVLLAQAEEVLKSAEAAYEEGQGGVLDLLDSERFLLNNRLVAERYRADYLQALAELEKAVGTRFPNI